MQRANPNDEDAPKKWYVTQVTAAQVDETQVAMDLADETTLNPSEAMMPIRQLRKILIRRLLGGESVKLGNWSSFSVTLSSTGAETKEAVTARNIKSVNLNFQPGSLPAAAPDANLYLPGYGELSARVQTCSRLSVQASLIR